MRIRDRIALAFEGVGIALEAIRSNKVRAALTILGVAIGVLVVVGMSATVQGITNSFQADVEAFGATAKIEYDRQLPALENANRETQLAQRAAASVVGEDYVDSDMAPVLASEDFACMSQQKPGAYAFLGQADAGHRSMIHSSRYDFNDELLLIGSSYWVAVVEQEMACTS